MTSSPEPVAVIRACKFFARVSPDAAQTLAEIAVLRTFARGQRIAEPGEPPLGMFIVLQGQVRVFTVAATGKEHTLHLVGPTQTFLEVAALGDFPVPASCEALEDTQALLLPAAALRRVLAEHPQLCLQVLTSMAFWVRHLLGLVEDLSLRDATGRFARYLLSVAEHKGAEFELPSLKKHLASHLNLTSETFSRTTRRLMDAGLIAAVAQPGGTQAIRILDFDGLEEASAGNFRGDADAS